MKKTISVIALALVCLFMLASCAPTGEPQTAQDNSELYAQAREYLINTAEPAWAAAFADAADCEALYAAYAAEGGERDASEFARYIQTHAGAPDNWQQLFEAEFAKSYDAEIVRYEQTDGGLYTAYVMIDGSEVPYVTLNPITGYFHG